MKNFKKGLVICLLIITVLTLSFVTGCKKKETPFVDQGEVGSYYSFVEDTTISLSLDERAFTLTTSAGVQTGKYTFDGTALVITFDGEAGGVNVNYETNKLTFTYKGSTYVLYRNVNYTATFNTNGGSSVTAQTVQAGKTVTKPVAPTKDGYQFIGWYADANFATSYDFSAIVEGDVTLYARFEENTNPENEFKVAYVTGVEGVTFEEGLTFQNTVYNLPELTQAGFAGWWVSDYEDASKLSYKFESGMLLKQDTVLYAVFSGTAPVVSVTDSKISWSSMGVNKQYAVNVKNVATEEVVYTKTVSTTYADFNFDNVAAGNYVVEVKCGDYTGKAYRANMLLPQVCKFKVEGFKLTWTEVEGATGYQVTVDCGISTHDHTNLVVDGTEYDFSACAMKADGINFYVTAVAKGALSSVSKAYNLKRDLATVSEIVVDDAAQKMTWAAVEGATSYKVTVTTEAGQTYTFTQEGTELTLDGYYGQLELSVTPQAQGYYAPATNKSYAKTALSTPLNITVTGYDVKWDAVKDAASYIIKIDGETYTSSTNTYSLSASEMDKVTDFKVTVQAVASDAKNNSLVSKETKINKEGVTTIAYANGKVSWNSVAGISKFAVKIDNGEVKIVNNATEVEYPVDGSGQHTIYVTTADSKGNYGEFTSYVVEVYALKFEANGGKAIESVYYVKGDTIKQLPTAEYKGYTFLGWYSTAEASQVANNEFKATTFDAETDITIYADWTGNKYNALLDYGTYGTGTTEKTETVFASDFTLPVPEAASTLKTFKGWFSEQNGQGIQYTNELGESIIKWLDYNDKQLYAGYVDIFEFVLNEAKTEYSVKKGDGISYLSNIVIPATYEYIDEETKEVKQLPVTVIDAGAFSSCTTLVSITVPASIRTIEVGSKGPKDTTCCFYYCSKLEAVNVKPMTDAELAELKLTQEDVIYSSIDGVLIKKESKTGHTEIAYFPAYTKTGTYVIPSTVTSIPQNTFKSCTSLEGLVIPANVVEINDCAFMSCSGLLTVTFSDPEEGKEAQELRIGTSAFQGCSKLTEINLPARLVELGTGKATTTTSTSNPNDASLDVRIRVFDSCTALTSINVVGTYEGQKYASIDGVITNYEKTQIVYYPKGREGEYTIPTGVTSIGEFAFAAATKLTTVTIPGAVTSINKGAFKGCTGLTAVNFLGTKDDFDLTIKESAFYGCTNTEFTSVVLPANLKKMERQAFGYTSKLTTVEIKTERTAIDFATNAFGYVASTTANAVYTFYVTDLLLGKSVPEIELAGIFGNKLERVDVDAANPNYTSKDGVLYNKAETLIAYFPTGRTGEYIVPTSVKTIGDRTFQSRNISSIVIHAGVTEIGESAFQSCTKLESVTFVETAAEDTPVNLTIGKSAFQSCSLLTTLVLPTRLVSIGDAAFASCSKITEFNIPEGVKTIGKNAFQYCSKVEKITLPSTLVEITESENIATATTDKEARIRAFDSCTVLKEIVVAEGNKNFKSANGLLLRALKEDAEDAEKITSYELVLCPAGLEGEVKVPAGISKIANYSFYNAKLITKVSFPDGAVQGLKLGNYVFYSCAALTDIELPSGLVEIDKYAIYSCPLLTTITIPNTVEKIEQQAFASLTNLTTVTFEEGNLETPLVFDDCVPASSEYGSTYYAVFYSCSKLTSLVLPERTTVIGKYAFTAMTGLQSVKLPSTLTEIRDHAFYNSTALTEVKFAEGPSKLTYIGYYAFYGNKFEEIELPEGILQLGNKTSATATVISGSVFYSNTKLKKVVLPSTLQEIGSWSFYGCTSLTDLTFRGGKSNLTYIGNNAFYNTKITSFTFPETIETIEYKAFSNCKKLASITFEEGENGSSIKNIGYQAFINTAITSFRFPSCGVNSTGAVNTIKLGYGAATTSATPVNLFEGCKDLEEIYISESIVSVDNLFVKCAGLKKIIISEKSVNFKTSDTQPIIMSYDGTSIKYVYGRLTGTFEVPAGTESISDLAFANQAEIEKIILPASIKTIGTKAFQNCFSLKTVEFAEGCTLQSLGEYVFNNCISLESIAFPEYLTALPNYAFNNCTSLSSIDFGKVTTLGNYVFNCCSSLKEINMPATITTNGTYTFRNCTGLEKATVSKGLTKMGNYMFYGCSSLKDVTLEEGLTTVGSYMFQNCTSLETVKIPSTVTTIGTYAFAGCSALKSINIPAACTSLGNTTANTGTSYTFNNCTALETVTFDGTSTLKIIPGYAFQNCTSLKTFNFPASITNINNSAFVGAGLTSIDLSGTKVTQLGSSATAGATFAKCADLAEVKLGTKITKVYYAVFQGCTSLTSFTLPKTVTILGNNVFEGAGLTEFKYEGKITTKGTNIFKSCVDLATVTIASTETQIGSYEFYGCTSLKTIKLPSTLTKIGTYAFAYSGLTEITIPATVTSLSAGTTTATYFSSATCIFSNCADLTKVEIEGKVVAFGSKLFEQCVKLTDVTIPASLQVIGTYAFDGCTSLTSLDLSGTAITSIGTSTTSCYTFRNCTSLEEVKLPAGVTRITGYAFQNCEKLASITEMNSLAYIGTYAFDNCSLESFVFPSTLGTIGTYAFRSNNLKTVDLSACKTLTTVDSYVFTENQVLESVTFTDTIKTFGTRAFYHCYKLGNVTLPANLTTIGEGAFESTAMTAVHIPSKVTAMTYPWANCNLTSVTTDSPSVQIYEDMAIVLVTDKTAKIVQVYKDGKDIVIPEGVTDIGTRAFFNRKFDSVTLPSTMTTLTNYAFSYSDVKHVILSDTITAIGNYAFEYSSTEKVTLGDSLVTVGTYCFQYSDVSEIENAGKITYVGNYAFKGVKNIESLEWENLVQVANYGFEGWTGLKEFIAPATLKYMGGTNSSVPTASSSGFIFKNCTNLTKVVLNEGLEVLGTYTFGFSTAGDVAPALKEVTLPSTLTACGNYLFKGATELEKVIIKTPVLGTYTFAGVESLKEVVFENCEMVALGNYSFDGCTGLTSISLPEKLETVGTYAFRNCTALTSVTFNSAVTTIGSYAFANCTALKNVSLHEGLVKVDTYAFSNTGLETIKLPSTTEQLANYSFANNEFLTTVELNEGLTTLGAIPTSAGVNSSGYVFLNNTALENITLPSTLETIGQSTFSGCTKIKSITIPESCSLVAASAFDGWTADQTINVETTLYEATAGWYIGVTYSVNTNFLTGSNAKWVWNCKAVSVTA